MEEPRIYHANDAVVEAGMAIFMHVIPVDGAHRLTMSLGETGIVHTDRFEPGSSAPHEVVMKEASEVAGPSIHAGAGRIGVPPPARVRMMRKRTIIRLATLNVAPTRNAGV